MLTRIVYLSTATALFDRSRLDALLATSRRNNGRDGITGLLLYDRGSFVQAVEGEAVRLQALMARLERDPRHHSLQVVDSRPVSARMFADWSMGSAELAPAALAGIARQVAAVKANAATAMLKVFLHSLGAVA